MKIFFALTLAGWTFSVNASISSSSPLDITDAVTAGPGASQTEVLPPPNVYSASGALSCAQGYTYDYGANTCIRAQPKCGQYEYWDSASLSCKGINGLCGFGERWGGASLVGGGCVSICPEGQVYTDVSVDGAGQDYSCIPNCSGEGEVLSGNTCVCDSPRYVAGPSGICERAENPSGCTPDPDLGLTCPESPPEIQVALPTISECRAANYSADGCLPRLTSHQIQDLRTLAARESELAAACENKVVETNNTCSNLKTQAEQRSQSALAQFQSSLGSSSEQVVCGAADFMQSALSSLRAAKEQCSQQIQACSQTCNQSVTVIEGMAAASVNNNSCSSLTGQYVSPMEQNVSSIASSQGSASQSCQALKEESKTEDTAGEDRSNGERQSAHRGASKVSGLSGLAQRARGLINGGRGELAGGGAGMPRRASSNPGFYQSGGSAYSKSGGASGLRERSSSKAYDSNRNLGAYDEGINANFNMGSDKPLGSGAAAGGKPSAMAAVPGARGGGSGFLPSSSDGANGLVGGKNQRGFKTVKARNLVQGFKSLKASNGGATLSLKPSDYKEYGAQGMKQKLAEAQKKFGKDMPLIFKNGQFVLDFLAMKETEMFRSKRVAMQKFWSGEESRKPTYIEDLDVHQNSNAKIWSLLHLRYRKEFKNWPRRMGIK